MKSFVKHLLVMFLIFLSFSFAVKRLGAWYEVAQEKSPYHAREGDKSLSTLPVGTRVRLIKDDSVMDTVILAPVRIITIMLTFKPRGNWLVEDEQGNRGYMWASDLRLSDNQN